MTENKALPEYASELQKKVKELGLSINEAARQANINEVTFRGIYRGDRESVNDITHINRKRIYNTFKLSSFHAPEFDPINPGEDSPQLQLKKFISDEYDGSVDQFAKASKIHSSTIYDFLGRRIKSPRSNVKQRLYAASNLACFNQDRKLSVETPVERPSALVAEPREKGGLLETLLHIEEELSNVKYSLTQNLSSYEAAKLLQNREPNVRERMQLVEVAIDILVDQMNYFKTSSQEEREALVKHLRELDEVERWGYVVNILSGIHKPGNTPDTFARTLEAPQKARRIK